MLIVSSELLRLLGSSPEESEEKVRSLLASAGSEHARTILLEDSGSLREIAVHGRGPYIDMTAKAGRGYLLITNVREGVMTVSGEIALPHACFHSLVGRTFGDVVHGLEDIVGPDVRIAETARIGAFVAITVPISPIRIFAESRDPR